MNTFKFGVGHTYIIAELSCNHLQDYNLAVKTIHAMKKSGADAVKLQLDNPDGGITIDSDADEFIITGGTLWDGKTLYELYKETYTPWEWHAPLQKLAKELGLDFFSTPSCKPGVDYLEKLNVPIYKIASFEITDTELIRYTASKGKPMIISTGIAQIEEIQDAVKICHKVGNHDITLLKCTSSYPAPIDQANLRTMVNMKETFGVRVGLSDHSLGKDVAVAAAALGAEVIEKHFIFDRTLGGPDADFSMEPHEFKAMVDSIRNVESAMGVVDYSLSEAALNNRSFSRSLFVIDDIKKGDLFSEKNIGSIRPGSGLHPKNFKKIVGRRASGNFKLGQPLAWEMISKEKE